MKNLEKDGDKNIQDQPLARQRWFRKGRTLPDGRPAAEYLIRANQQKMEQRSARDTILSNARQAIQGAAFGGGFNLNLVGSSTTTWLPMGPAPISPDNSGIQNYGPSIGRTTAVAVDQTDQSGNTVWIGGAYGGVWATDNAAGPVASVNWHPMLDYGVSLAVGTIGIKPNDGNTVVVGTGEGNFSADSYYGVGIYRTTDRGRNWILTTTTADGFTLKGLSFTRTAWSRTNTNVLVMGANWSTYSNAPNLNMSRGAYYSTDAGATWRLSTFKDGTTTVTGSYGFAVMSVYWNPADQRFYAAVRGHGFYQSAVNDPSTFTRLPNQPGTQLAMANCSSSSVLATCDILRGEITSVPGRNELYVIYVGYSLNGNGTDYGVWKSTDSGNSWMKINMNDFDSCSDGAGCGISQGFYNLWIAAVPNPLNNANTDLYLAAVNQFKCTVRSTDTTTTACATTNSEPNKWMNLTHVYGCTHGGDTAHVHPDNHAIDYPLTNTNMMYFGHDGGVSRNLNPGSMTTGSCSAVNPYENLSGTMGSMGEYVWGTPHPTDITAAIGGTQDNGSSATNSTIAAAGGAYGLNWTAIHGGDGGYTDIRSSNTNFWFTSYTYVTVQGCTTGFTCTDATFYPYVEQFDVGNDGSSFYTPYMLDPQDDTKLYVATCRLWKGVANVTPTSFATTVWTANPGTAISPKLTTGVAGQCSNSETDYITGLGFGGANSGGSKVIWAVTDGGQVWRTTNADAGASATWINRNLPASINPGAVWVNRFPVSSVVVDRVDATGNTAYVTIQGFQIAHVARTTDGGATWTDITNNLPDSPANNITIDPDDHNVVYVATDVGVYVSSNALTSNTPTWVEVGPASSSTNAGWLPNALVSRVTISKAGGAKRLIAVTYGRGLFYADLLQTGTPAITFNPAGPLSFGNVSIGSSSTPQTLTITNTGTAPLIVNDSNESDSQNFSVNSINCPQLPATFAAGAGCQLSIVFNPTSAGAKSDTLSLYTNVPTSPTNITFNGTGGSAPAPVVSLSVTSWPFGDVAVGGTSFKAVTLSNTGNAALTINSIGLTGTNTNQYSVVNNNCPIAPSTLAAGNNCLFTVTFAPTVIQAGLSASVSISDNASGTPHTVTLSGNGVATTFTFLPTPIAFGNQLLGTQSTAQTVTLTNTGAGTLTINTAPALGGTNPNQFTITSNGCGTTLPSLATCTVGVAFKPTVTGAASATLSFTSNGTGTGSVSLSGTGIAPVMGFNPTTLTFNSQRVGTTSTAQTLTLNNTGAAALNVSGVVLAGQYTRTGGTCAATAPFQVAANSSCTYLVAFAPTSTGAQNGSITITDDAAGSPHQATFTGTGTQSTVALSSPTLAFGSLNITKTSNAQTLTVTNNGTATLNVSSAVVSGQFTKFADTCTGTPVNGSGGSCTIQVKFAPTTLGAQVGDLAITSDAPTSVDHVGLTGTGTQPVVSLAPTTLPFVDTLVNQSTSAQTSTLSNTGTGPLTIASIATANTTDWTVTTTTCGATFPAVLNAGSNCTISVVFNPKSLGAHNTTVTITDDASGSPRTINLTGSGVGPTLALQDNTGTAITPPLAFGNQRINTASAGTVVRVANTGTAPLHITAPTYTGTNPGDFSTSATTCGTFPATINVGAFCTITVKFTPAASGARSASLSVSSDSTTGATTTLAMTGTGTAPTISPAPTPLAFGAVRVGTTTAAQTITVTNNGTDTLNISTVTLSNNATNDYALAVGGTCSGAAVAVNANCVIKVTFTPHATGAAAAASVVITSDTGALAGTVTNVGLTGSGKAPAITVTTPQDWGVVKVNTATPKTITITNSGTDTLNISTVVLSGNTTDFVKTTDNCSGAAVGFTAPNNTCTVIVTFTSHAAGAAAAGTMTISHDATGSPTAVTLNGTGAVPTASITPNPLAFGGKPITVSNGPSAITVTNTSQVPLVVSNVVLAGADFSQTNTCTTNPIAANASCSINVTFKPTTTGAKNGTVTITHDGTGSPATVNLTGTGEDFAPPALTTTTATVSKGGTANYGNVTIAPSGGSFSTAITFNCSGLPTGAACVFNPATVTPGAASATTALTITTAAATGVRPVIASTNSNHKPLMAMWLMMPGMALLLPAFAGGKRRKWLVRLGLIAFCLLMLISLAACGSGSSSSSSHNPGTPAGTYTVGIVATSTGLSHSTNVTLTVQ